MRRFSFLFVLTLVVCLGAPTVSAQQILVTVGPDDPNTGNCFPFGNGSTGGDAWGPTMAFFYQNVPPFELEVGDILAFDLGAPNDTAIEMQIDLATHDGAAMPNTATNSPWVMVASNAQTPDNPFGNSTIGDYELAWMAEAPFSFPGGNLMIRFSNPSAAYLTDTNCDGVLVYGSSGDSSGYFLARAYHDADGDGPWEGWDGNAVGAFQIRRGLSSVPTVSPLGLTLLCILMAAAGVVALRRVV